MLQNRYHVVPTVGALPCSKTDCGLDPHFPSVSEAHQWWEVTKMLKPRTGRLKDGSEYVEQLETIPVPLTKFNRTGRKDGAPRPR